MQAFLEHVARNGSGKFLNRNGKFLNGSGKFLSGNAEIMDNAYSP